MAWNPAAVKKEIRPGVNDPVIIPIGVILHVDSGNSASLFNYFNGPSGGIESHFHTPKVNQLEQYRNTGYEADANLKANSFIVGGKTYGFLSMESQGYDVGEWNAKQLKDIKDLIVWAREVHPLIQARRCPGPFSSGIGYHTMWGAPSAWTPVAKDCPGKERIAQFNNVIVPWLSTLGKPTNPTQPNPAEEDAMTLAEFEAYMRRLYNPLTNGTAGKNQQAIMTKLAAMGTDIAAIKLKLGI